MGGHPFANALHRYVLARNEIALDEGTTERGKRVAVVRVIVDAQRRAVLQDYPSGTLDLNCKQVEWILEPADFKFLAVERAGLDGAAVVIRHELAFSIEPADPPTLVWKGSGTRLPAAGDQVARAAVDRDMKFRTGKARALNHRLEITGQQSRGLTQARDAHGLKIFFEEGASGICIPRPHVRSDAAQVPQGAVDGAGVVGAL